MFFSTFHIINSQNLNFEICKSLVEELEYIKVLFNNQNVEVKNNIEADIFNYYFQNSYVCISCMFIRGGKLLGINNKIIPVMGELKDTIEYYIASFYKKHNIVPKEVIVPSIVDLNIINYIE